jgi:hypothetical protein
VPAAIRQADKQQRAITLQALTAADQSQPTCDGVLEKSWRSGAQPPGEISQTIEIIGAPKGNRTPVSALRDHERLYMPLG